MTALTSRFHKFQVSKESEHEMQALYHGQEINFFEILTGRSQRYLESGQTIGGSITYDYLVEVNYYRAINPSGSNFTAIRDAFETLFSLVTTELGATWQDTVEIWQPDDVIPAINEELINNIKCWKGTTRYTATKNTNL